MAANGLGLSVLCESCGSIKVARTRSSNLDKIVRWLSGRKRFSCSQCGWTARRDWHQPPSEDVRPQPMKSVENADADEDFDIDKFH
jgi:hypothetical protein